MIHFFWGVFALALVSSCCLRVTQATLCPAPGLGVRAEGMGMHGPPFTRRRTLPLVKRAKKRVRIFVAEKVSGFIQLPARNAADNVARVRVALLRSTAGTSRVPQSGGAAASACSTVVRGQHPAELAAGPREAWPSASWINPREEFSAGDARRH